jgi:hypothetical protein
MALPKTKYTIFETKLPSNNSKVKYRQMLVRDEKILLTAKASEDEGDIYRAVKQVVNNCILDDIDIDTITTFDIEYMFIKIRAVSVDNVIELSFIDKTDKNEYKFFIDLDDVTVKYPENTSNLIQIDDETGFTMRYPPASLFDERDTLIESDKGYELLAAKCIDKIFDNGDTYDCKDYPIEELVDYVENLDTKSYDKAKDFLRTMPCLNYVITYQTKGGVDRKITLNTLTDFFTFW